MLQFLQTANYTLGGGARRRLSNPLLKGSFAPVDVRTRLLACMHHVALLTMRMLFMCIMLGRRQDKLQH